MGDGDEEGIPIDRWTVLGATTMVGLLVLSELVLPPLRGSLGLAGYGFEMLRYGIYLSVFIIWMAWFVWTGFVLWQWAEGEWSAEE